MRESATFVLRIANSEPNDGQPVMNSTMMLQSSETSRGVYYQSSLLVLLWLGYKSTSTSWGQTSHNPSGQSNILSKQANNHSSGQSGNRVVEEAIVLPNKPPCKWSNRRLPNDKVTNGRSNQRTSQPVHLTDQCEPARKPEWMSSFQLLPGFEADFSPLWYSVPVIPFVFLIKLKSIATFSVSRANVSGKVCTAYV